MFASRLFMMLFGAATFVAAQAGEAEEIAASLSHGQADNALQAADRALAKTPKDARLRLLRGNALAQLGRNAEAIQVYTALTSDYPNLPEPYNNLAALYAQQGQLDKARTTLQMALQTNPAYATAHANLADVYAKLAAQAYEKALQRDVVERQSGQTGVAVSTSVPRLAMVQDLVSSNRAAPAVASKPLVVAQAPVSVAPAPVPASKPAEKPVAPTPAVATAGTPAASNTPPKPAPVPTPTPAKVVPPPATSPTQLASNNTPKPATVTPSPTPMVASKPAAPAPSAPPPAKPVEAEPSKPAPTKAESSKEAESQVARAVNGWAEAWADKRVAAYLGSYTKAYKPAGSSRSDWEKQRRERIEGAKKITVRLGNLKIKLDGSLATVRFVQSYSSDTTEKSTVKTLILERNGDRWLIREERVG